MIQAVMFQLFVIIYMELFPAIELVFFVSNYWIMWERKPLMICLEKEHVYEDIFKSHIYRSKN